MNNPISVLLLEDSIYDAEIILYELRKQGMKFVNIHAYSKEQFLEGLKKRPDIILADYSLPQFTANEALKLMKELGYDIPFIVISGMIGEELAVEMMRLGASDYLMKDRLGRLSTAVATALESAELRKTNDQYTKELIESNARYKSLFNDSPISLWEEDFSSLKILLDELTTGGITDLRKYFLENPEALDNLCQSRNLITINQATVELYGASSKEEAYNDLSNIEQYELKVEFMEYALAFYSGAKQYHRQTWHTTVHGEPIYVSIHVAIAPNHLETWDRVYISIVDLTVQAKAQQQVAQSESLLSSMVDSSLDWIYVKDKDHRYILANQTFADGLNMEKEDIIGKNDEEIGFSAETAENFREANKRILESGEPETYFNEELKREDHKELHFSTIKTPLYDANGNSWGVMGISRDISDQLKTEAALAESQQNYESLFNSLVDGMFVHDLEGKILVANPIAHEKLGYKPGELVGRHLDDIALTDPNSPETHHLDQLKLEGHIRFKTHHRAKDGSIVPLDVTSNLVEFRGQQAAIAIMRDISDIIKTQEELEQSEELLRAVINSSPDSILVKDRNQVISLANQATADDLGVAPEFMIGKTDVELGYTHDQIYGNPEKGIIGFRELDELVFEQGKEAHQIIPFALDGKMNYFDAYEVPLRDAEGNVTSALVYSRNITEIIQTQKELEQSEEQYRALFDTVPDIIILCENNGNIVHVNQAVVKLSGYSYQQLTAKHISELINEGEKLFVLPDNTDSSDNDRSNLTMEIETNSGDIRLLDINIQETLFDGHPNTMLVGRDQTDRILAERKTQEMEGLLRTMIDIIPQPIFVYDEDGYYVIANQNIAELFQTEQENIIGKSNTELAKEGIISPDEAVIYHENAMIPLMTRNTYFRPVDTYTDPDGIKHWFQIYTSPFRLPDGTMWVVGVGNEITHQMQAQSRLEALNEALERRVEERTRDLDTTNLELQKAKEQLESILSHSPDGFLLLDADKNIQVMNPAFSKIIGIEAETDVGKNVMLTVANSNKDLISNAIQQAIDTHKSLSIEHKATHKDGSTFDCLTSISPIYSEDVLVGVVIGVHDITPQKEVQRMKDAFVSNVSHELRTPITNFICNLELIRMNPQKQDIYLERLDLEIIQLKNIIEDLLRLSRFDQNATNLKRTPFDINDMCKEFSSLRTPLAEQKQLSMAFIPHEELPKVLADYGLISQVLSILLTNAINYTQTGGEILIRTHPEDEKHLGMIGFSVADNGPGISPEEKEKLFDRFFRGNAAISSQVAGTGLGLPIAKEIVERHQGIIEVFSRGIPGDGTRFFIWLPINTGEDID